MPGLGQQCFELLAEGRQSPQNSSQAFEPAIADSIEIAEQIMARIDGR
jgi:hypothetical protein